MIKQTGNVVHYRGQPVSSANFVRLVRSALLGSPVCVMLKNGGRFSVVRVELATRSGAVTLYGESSAYDLSECERMVDQHGDDLVF